MMGQHQIRTQTLLEGVRHTLRQTAGIYEHKRRTMSEDQLGDAIVNLGPHLIGRHGTELITRNFHSDFHLTAVAHVDDARMRAEKLSYLIDGLNSSREADALW